METTYYAPIVVGNLSIPAKRYMESRGTIIEEVKGVFFLTIPRTADMNRERLDEFHHTACWLISFDDEDEPGAMNVVLEVELHASDSRVYTLSL